MGVPEPEDVEEVPGDRGDPGGVQGLQLDPPLQHRLEPERQREWNLNILFFIIKRNHYNSVKEVLEN